MKFSLNKIALFLRGLIKYFKPSSVGSRNLYEPRLMSYGTPLHGKVKQGNGGLLLSFVFTKDGEYEKFINSFEGNLALDLWVLKVQRRLLDLSNPLSLSQLDEFKNSTDIAFIISGVSLYPPDDFDPRGQVDFITSNWRDAPTVGDTVSVIPIVDKQGLFCSLEWYQKNKGVDNTDLNNLLKEATTEGNDFNWTDALVKGTITGVNDAKAEDRFPFGSPGFIAEFLGPRVRIGVGKTLWFNPTFKDQQETLTTYLDAEGYEEFKQYFLDSFFSRDVSHSVQGVKSYKVKAGDIHPLREFTEGNRAGLVYVIEDILIEELDSTKQARITLEIDRFVWPNTAPSHLGRLYNLIPVLDESGKLLAFVQESQTEIENKFGCFKFIPELRLPVTQTDVPDELKPSMVNNHVPLVFGGYMAFPDGIENTKEYKQDLEEVMAKDMEYIRDHILNTLGIPKECILPQGDDLLEIYSRPFWQKYHGVIQGNVKFRLDECRNNIDTIMLPIMVGQGLTVTAQTIAPENLNEVKMLVDISTMSDEKYKELEALRIEKYGE